MQAHYPVMHYALYVIAFLTIVGFFAAGASGNLSDSLGFGLLLAAVLWMAMGRGLQLLERIASQLKESRNNQPQPESAPSSLRIV